METTKLCTCGQPARNNSSRCETCWRKKKQSDKKRRNEPGRCHNCHSTVKYLTGQPGGRGRLCLKCFFKHTSYRWFGTFDYWKDLKQKFLDQQGRCAYSGRKMYPGKNAELDHIHPRSKGGDDTLDNVIWVVKKVNLLKLCDEPEDFFKLIEEIYHYYIVPMKQGLKPMYLGERKQERPHATQN